MTPAQQLQRQLAIERRVWRKYEAEFNRFGRDASAAFSRAGLGGALSQVAEHEEKLARILKPHMIATALEAGSGALLSLGKSYDWAVREIKARSGRTPEEVVATAARRYAETWSARRADEIAATSSKRVSAAVQRGIANNDPPAAIAASIVQATGGSVAKFRAVMIAQTETHSAWNAGSLETAKESDLELNKVWDSTNDDRTREDHDAANGQAVGLDETFDVGGENLEFPGDPSGSGEQIINCRCTMVYRPS